MATFHPGTIIGIRHVIIGRTAISILRVNGVESLSDFIAVGHFIRVGVPMEGICACDEFIQYGSTIGVQIAAGIDSQFLAEDRQHVIRGNGQHRNIPVHIGIKRGQVQGDALEGGRGHIPQRAIEIVFPAIGYSIAGGAEHSGVGARIVIDLGQRIQSIPAIEPARLKPVIKRDHADIILGRTHARGWETIGPIGGQTRQCGRIFSRREYIHRTGFPPARHFVIRRIASCAIVTRRILRVQSIRDFPYIGQPVLVQVSHPLTGLILMA